MKNDRPIGLYFLQGKAPRPNLLDKAPSNAVKFYCFADKLTKAQLSDPTVRLRYKMGVTRHSIYSRMYSHGQRGGENVEMIVIFVLMIQKVNETKLKVCFKKYAVNSSTRYNHHSSGQCGEWFWACPEIDDWITFMLKQQFVARDEKSLESIPYCDNAESWLPKMQPHKEELSGFRAYEKHKHSNDLSHLEPTVSNSTGAFFTPKIIIDRVHNMWAQYGGIDLDPASCPEANRIVNAKTFFGEREDGLVKSWDDDDYRTIFCNVPFGEWTSDKKKKKEYKLEESGWMRKVMKVLDKKPDKEFILLAPEKSRCSKVFEEFVKNYCTAYLTPRNRIKYWGEHTGWTNCEKGGGSPTSGTYIYYVGKHLDLFIKEFEQFGNIELGGWWRKKEQFLIEEYAKIQKRKPSK